MGAPGGKLPPNAHCPVHLQSNTTVLNSNAVVKYNQYHLATMERLVLLKCLYCEAYLEMVLDDERDALFRLHLSESHGLEV